MKFLKKAILGLIVLALAGGGYYYWKHREKAPTVTYYRAQPVKMGDVTQEVTATGTVNPVKSVKVTTQVTGKVISLKADYNSRVKQGDLIAMIDPQTYESALASQRAQLKSNEAQLERTIAQLTLAKKELERAKKLAEKKMISDSDLDNAQASYDQLVATKKSNEAAIEQSRASVKTAETNLSYCTITAPVSGIVISRSVDEGETVVSNMSASALFTIATDLKRIQVEASVPEADVGGIKVGQAVNFTVDAYKRRFKGKVTEIRLASTTTSNVVTYPVIVEAENPGERLFPGMTANLSIIIAEADKAVTVPASAVRFTPMDPAVAATAPQIRERGNRKVIWIADSDTQIHPVEVQLGISDGINQELKDAEDLVGQQVVTGTASSKSVKQGGDQTKNPFMPQRPRRGGGAGGPPPR